MATFGGNFLCRTSSLGLQARVFLIPWMKKSSGIQCTVGKANSSSFPVKYIPKKSRSAEKIQTSSKTMKGPKDDVIMNGFEESEWSLEVPSKRKEFPNERKSSQAEKLQTSSITIKGPKDKISSNGLYENELRFEVSNGGTTVKYIPKKSRSTEKLQTSSTSMKCPKDEVIMNGFEENEFSLEVPNERNEVPNERKSSQTEKLQTYSTTIEDPKNKISTNGLDENELRFEVSNGGKSSQRSFFWDKKSKNKNQIQTPVHYFNPDVNQEVGKGIDIDEGLLETECIEEREEVVEELDMYEKSLHTQDVLQVGGSKQDAENFAIELLAMRAYTAVELRKKLLGKRFPLDMVDAVILDFQSRGLINDGLFAETFCQSRWSSSNWGPGRIKQALRQKGVREADAEKAINYVFKDSSSDGEEESTHGLSKTSMDKLLAQASKQWLRGRDATKETRKTRIIRWLQYRGFNWGVVSFIVKKLESQCPP